MKAKMWDKGKSAGRPAAPGTPEGAILQEGLSPYVPSKPSRNAVLAFGLFVFTLFFLASSALCLAIAGVYGFVCFAISLAVAIVACMTFRIALSWEKAVVLRFGVLNRVAGPGLYVTIPFIEHVTAVVDQRIVATPFYAEKTLTADLVPVNIDAVLYWMVRDAEQACTEVEDYYAAVSLLAHSALRDAVGRSTVAEVALRRDQLDVEIKNDIEKQAAEWGIDIISVKVRDIVLPDELQESMSLEAQADRERNARMSVASAEVDLAEMLAEAAQRYGDPSAAMQLRTMLMQYETVKESKSSVVTMPTPMSEGFFSGSDGSK